MQILSHLALLHCYNLPKSCDCPPESKNSILWPIHNSEPFHKTEIYAPIHIRQLLSLTPEHVRSKFFVIKLITRFSSAQHGFLPKKSLVTQPTASIKEVLAAFDSGSFTAPANFNFLEAFDSSPHS